MSRLGIAKIPEFPEGVLVRDRYTGFVGTVLGYSLVLGRFEYYVAPRMGTDGEQPDGVWIDAKRIELADGKVGFGR